MGDGSLAFMADKRTPVAHGWLSKRGPSFEFKWEKRWCAVYSGDKNAATNSEAKFVYYQSEDDASLQKEPLGKISLQAKTAAWPVTKMEAPGDAAKHSSQRPFSFVLDENRDGGKNRRLYYFDAIDADQLELWISGIGQIVTAMQDGKCVPSSSSGNEYMRDLDQQKQRISVLLENMQVTGQDTEQQRKQRISELRSQAKKRISEAHQDGRLAGQLSAAISRSSILDTSSQQASEERQQRLSELRSAAKKRISSAHKDGRLQGQISSTISRTSVVNGEPVLEVQKAKVLSSGDAPPAELQIERSQRLSMLRGKALQCLVVASQDGRLQESLNKCPWTRSAASVVTKTASPDLKDEQRMDMLRSKASARLAQANENGTLREHCTKQASMMSMVDQSSSASTPSDTLQPSSAEVAKGQRASILANTQRASILANKRASILSTNPRLSILKSVAKSRLSTTLNDGSLKERLAALEVRREERKSLLGGSLPGMAFGRQPTAPTNHHKELARKGEARHILTGEEHLEEYEVDREKGLQTRELIIAAMKHDRITMLLDSKEVDMILRTMQYFKLEAGDVVVKEGELGNHFFVTHSGTLEVSVDGKTRDSISSGGSFGALALLYKCPRTATITAKEASGVWGADGKTFNKVLQEHTEKHRSVYRKFLQSVPLLEAVPDRHMDHILDATAEEVVEPGERVVTEGDPMTALYVVRKGMLKIVKGGTVGSDGVLVGGEEIATLRPGDHFGERALLSSEPRSSTVVAVHASDLLCLAAAKLEESLGSDLRTCLEWHQIRTGFLTSQYMSRLPLTQRSACLQRVEIRETSSTEQIDEKFMCLIVISGEITVTSCGGQSSIAPSGTCVDGIFSGIELPCSFRHTYSKGSRRCLEVGCFY